MTTFLLEKIKKKEIEKMLQNNEKTTEVLRAEKIVEQAKAGLVPPCILNMTELHITPNTVM